MALQFDGNGIVTFPSITLSGAFTITGTFTYQSASTQILVGSTPNNQNFIACFTGGVLRGRVNTTNTEDVTGLTNGQEYDFILTRDASNVVTIEVVGVAVSSARVISGDFIVDNFGSYNSGTLKYTGLLSNDFVFNDAGTDVRSYNFEQAPGSTTVPDSISSQDGTLSGFTTGDFTEPAGAGITITSPTAYTAKARDGSGNATFTISGTCADTVTAVEVSTDNSTWSTLDASPTTTYSGTVVVNGQKTVYVRAANDISDTASVEGITAAMGIVAWGQSNCAGRGVNNQTYTTPVSGLTPVMYRNGVYSQMSDPTGIDSLAAGSMWPLIAQRYIDEGIPVCIANVAEGGTSIQAWQTGGSLYPRITGFVSSFGVPEITVSVIGESDSGGTTKADFKTRYLAVTNQINTDYSAPTYAVKFPIGSNTNTATQTEIREAYDELIAENAFILSGGDLSVIDIDTGVGEDGLHLKTDQHLSEGAAIIEAALFGELSEITLDIGAPDGTYKVYLLDQSDNVVYNGNATFSGGSATLSGLTVAAGATLEGYTIDNESPHVNGAVITGVTV